MRFIHCADLHLGTTRFGNDRLTQDFSRSFRRMAEDAVTRSVDAVIICGDLFNRSSVNQFPIHEHLLPGCQNFSPSFLTRPSK